MPTQTPAKEPGPAYTRKVLIALALLVLALFLWKIAPVLLLMFAGIVFAIAIRAGAVPLARRTGMGELWAVSIVSVVAIAILLAGGVLFGQRIAEEANALWTAFIEAWTKFEEFIGKFPIGQTAMENMKTGTDTEAIAKVAKGTFIAFGAVADVFLVIFLALYLAADPHTYKRGFLHLIPPSVRERVSDAMDASGTALRKWFVGQLGAMIVVGILTGVGLWLIGVPLALPLAILSGILDFVPVIGPFVAAVPGVLIAFSQSPELGLYAALVYLAVQFVEGNIVMPMAQKWAVSVPPALSLLGIVGFGLVFGLAGVLFAMPLLVVTMVLVQKLYVERIEE